MSMNDNQLLVAELEKVNLYFPTGHSYEKIAEDLAEYINQLIDSNFTTLLSLLYRLDISEDKLRTSLDAGTGEPAGNLIALMIIERQLEKIESRKRYKMEGEIPEDEKW